MTSAPGTPPAEVEIDEVLVRALLRDQHPDLSEHPLSLPDAGWDNAMFRLGDALCVRLPRRELAAQLVKNEQRWLPELAPRLPLPVPAPQRIGRPGRGYPWHWSVLPWFEGTAADLARPDADQAEPLADFLCALHTPAPRDAPINEFRGCPLALRAAATQERIERLAASTELIGAGVVRAWQRALAEPVATEQCWLHGDLHARNVVTQRGAISAIIDWGDITSGDVATDLASIWALLGDSAARQRALDRYGASEGQRARATGWAVFFGVVLLDTGLIDNPRHAAMGELTLRRVSEDIAASR